MEGNGSRMLFVNLPFKDLDESVAFFTKLGFPAARLGGAIEVRPIAER